MTIYRERLRASPWVFIATGLVIPASLLVFLPISPIAGVIVALVLYGGVVVVLLVTAPVIEVTQDELVAGRARVPISLIGVVSCHFGDDATLERGQRLDARAWLMIRGWVAPVVKVEINDSHDPTPYWIISSRRPELVLEAIGSARAAAAV